MITLEKCDLKYREDFVDFIREFQEHGDEYGVLRVLLDIMLKLKGIDKKLLDYSLDEIREFFPKYVKYVLDCEKSETKPNKDWVEMDTYFICEDGKMIGEMRFRKRLVPFLLLHSLGHIGYSLKYSARGKGYGTIALGMLLNKIWSEKRHTELMISCRGDNIPSSRVIEKNGGVLNRIWDDDGIIRKEYWVFNNKTSIF